jgi:hypothetical protein
MRSLEDLMRSEEDLMRSEEDPVRTALLGRIPHRIILHLAMVDRSISDGFDLCDSCAHARTCLLCAPSIPQAQRWHHQPDVRRRRWC